MSSIKNIILYIGKSRMFPKKGWIHSCYFCESPTSHNFSIEYQDCIIEIYICHYCLKDKNKIDIYKKIMSNINRNF
jgi:hypothetical protein